MGKGISANVSFSRTDNPITKFNILGNSTQSGDNLFVQANAVLGDDFYLDDGTTSSNSSVSVYYIEANPNITYRFSKYEENSAYIRIAFTDENKSFISRAGAFQDVSGTFTTSAGTKYIQVAVDTNILHVIKIERVLTPDNPINMQNLGTKVVDTNDSNYNKYKVNLKSVGKNLINLNDLKVCQYGAVDNLQIIENGFSFEKKYQNYTSCVYTEIYLEKGKYKISGTWSSDNGTKAGWGIRIAKNAEGSPLIYNYAANGFGQSFTVLESTYYRIAFYDQYGAMAGTTTTYSNIQLEKGSTATSYEPYEEKNYDIYLNEPLRCANNICDYIDVLNKKIVRNVKSKTFDGTETWSKYVTIDNHYQTVVGDNSFGNTINNVFSNYYWPNSTNGNYYSLNDYAVLSVDGSRIRFKDKDVSTLDDWVSRVKEFNNNGTPLEVNYQLKTPIESYISLPDISELKDNALFVIDDDIGTSKIEME